LRGASVHVDNGKLGLETTVSLYTFKLT
jgi:hypothetical protein